MATQMDQHPLVGYLDMQAQVGITKHLGGFAATNALLERCYIGKAREVLYVGAGIGAGPSYIARAYGCHVTSIDLSARMIAWSRLRAREDGVADRIDLQVADVLSLPFAANTFDAVICESVLGFVEEKSQAIASCVRVAKPGGYVGLNETLWVVAPPPDLAFRMHEFGVTIFAADFWQALWDESGLGERIVTFHQIDTRAEIKSRIEWVGWRWALRAWRRLIWLYLAKPEMRRAINDQYGSAMDTVPFMGYGLFSGRK